MRRRYLATKDMCEIWPRRGWIALSISEPKSRVTAMLRPISQPKGQYKRDHVAPSGSLYLCNLNYRCPYGFPRRLRTRKTKPAIDFKFRVCVNFLQAMATAISSMGATGNNVVWRGMMINDGSGWKKSSMTGYGSAQLNARLWSCRTSGKPVRAQPVMGNKNEGKGLFAPLVVLARNIIGKKPFNQLRGKAIALHSQVITEFCKSIGADAKQRQGLIRLAKKNGEKLGFLA